MHMCELFSGLQTSQAGGLGTGFFKQGGLGQTGGLGTSIGGLRIIYHYLYTNHLYAVFIGLGQTSGIGVGLGLGAGGGLGTGLGTTGLGLGQNRLGGGGGLGLMGVSGIGTTGMGGGLGTSGGVLGGLGGTGGLGTGLGTGKLLGNSNWANVLYLLHCIRILFLCFVSQAFLVVLVVV